MLSLSEMRRSVALLEPIVVGRRVQRLIQPDDDTVMLELFGWDDEAEASGKLWLALCAHSKLGRIGIGDAPTAPPWPPEFAAFLKARMNRAKVIGLRLVNDDRLAALSLESREGNFELVLSLMGPRSNLYALDADGKVVAALKETTRTGKVWENPSKPEAASPGDDRWAKLDDAAYLQAVRSDYAEARERLELDTLRKRFESVMKKEFEFAERRTEKLQRDLEEAKRARDEKRHGELLKQVMSTLHQGDTHVLVRDYETGEDVNVKLDPNLTPAENLEKYFKKYHKGLVGTNMLGQQLEITKGYLDELRTLQQALAGITEPAALRDFAETPLIRELTDKHVPTAPPARRPKKRTEKKEVPGKLLPRRYKTTDDLEVWVGKSDAGNDYLTTKLAAGNDWFFHIEGYPGSHTILRTGGRKDPPQESVLEAAELCVHFSKMKDASKVDVHVVPIKNVSKPKGAKPGLVYVSQGKTIGLRRDPKRLERILNAKIE